MCVCSVQASISLVKFRTSCYAASTNGPVVSRERALVMRQEEADPLPSRGALLRRAHELLEELGQPVSEEQLIHHLFGAGQQANSTTHLWITLLRQLLEGSSLFERVDMPEIAQPELPGAISRLYWALTAWRSTQ